MKNPINTANYNAYQTYMPLDFNIFFEKDVPADDICRSVIEITEEVNIGKFVDFSHRNSHGYDGMMMFKLIILAKAEMGYVSTRELERLCKTDIRYMFIAQNQKPSHMAFFRFIHDNLMLPIALQCFSPPFGPVANGISSPNKCVFVGICLIFCPINTQYFYLDRYSCFNKFIK